MAIKKVKKTGGLNLKTGELTVPDAPKTAAPAEAGTTGTYEGYCVKCKEKGVKYKGAVVVSKTGMNMAQGPCPTCGTKISRILGKAK